MRWAFWKKEQEKRAGFTDALQSQLVSILTGDAKADPAGTAALEAASGAYSRALSMADVLPKGPRTAGLTAPILALTGRALIRAGEIIFKLDVQDGVVRLIPAGTFDIMGGPDPRTWSYKMDFYGPSRGSVTQTRRGDGVIHAMYSYDPSRPWRGIGPLGRAILTAQALANSERAAKEESNTPSVTLIPAPAVDSTTDTLKADIGAGKGMALLVQTMAGGWGKGVGSAPMSDWKSQKVQPNPAASQVNLRSDLALAVLGACGVPPSLFGLGSGGDKRESLRVFLHTSVQPLADILAYELSEKLDTAVSFSFDRLFASDISGRARAFQSLTGGGMDITKAAALSGLLIPDDSE